MKNNSALVQETPLARLVREQGRLKGWLAQEMGIDRWRLSKILAGEKDMTVKEASRAAIALGVSIETFLPGQEAEGARREAQEGTGETRDERRETSEGGE